MLKKNNKGITLIEVIVVLGVIGLMAPIIMNYVIEAFKNNATLTEKVRIQTTVSALMNNLERNIKEADIPITQSADSGKDVNKTNIKKKVYIGKEEYGKFEPLIKDYLNEIRYEKNL
jgi:prepilin-type N-terminal cleavage/methylation domain-containing protein